MRNGLLHNSFGTQLRLESLLSTNFSFPNISVPPRHLSSGTPPKLCKPCIIMTRYKLSLEIWFASVIELASIFMVSSSLSSIFHYHNCILITEFELDIIHGCIVPIFVFSDLIFCKTVPGIQCRCTSEQFRLPSTISQNFSSDTFLFLIIDNIFQATFAHIFRNRG